MDSNLQYWDKLKKPAEGRVKAIEAGRLKGKSDINPQWRYEVMTEVFGPCGVGWKFEIVKTWTEPGSENQVLLFVMLHLFIKANGAWSDPIPGCGGDFLVEKESRGLHSNDEALKMATTDALGAAMKMIGVAAEVYLGNYDGSKYLGDRSKKNPPAGDGKQDGESKGKPGNGQGTQGEYINENQKKAIEAIIGKNKLSRDMVKEFLYSRNYLGTNEQGAPTMAKMLKKVGEEILGNTDSFLKAYATWAKAKGEGRA